jgi:hypothetical protein
MTGRQLRDLVAEHDLPHRTWKRHIYVAVTDVLAALGLGGAQPSPAKQWDEAGAILDAARSRGRS